MDALLFYLGCGRGRSLQVHPRSFCVSFFAMVLRKGGEAFEYTRGRFAPPLCVGVLREGAGLLFRVYMNHSESVIRMYWDHSISCDDL